MFAKHPIILPAVIILLVIFGLFVVILFKYNQSVSIEKFVSKSDIAVAAYDTKGNRLFATKISYLSPKYDDLLSVLNKGGYLINRHKTNKVPPIDPKKYCIIIGPRIDKDIYDHAIVIDHYDFVYVKTKDGWMLYKYNFSEPRNYTNIIDILTRN